MPAIGAAASASSQRNARARSPPFLDTMFMVLMPSEKSCVSTAIVTTIPTLREA